MCHSLPHSDFEYSIKYPGVHNPTVCNSDSTIDSEDTVPIISRMGLTSSTAVHRSLVLALHHIYGEELDKVIMDRQF